MRIGVAKEIKSDEYRVALTPAGALDVSPVPRGWCTAATSIIGHRGEPIGGGPLTMARGEGLAVELLHLTQYLMCQRSLTAIRPPAAESVRLALGNHGRGGISGRCRTHTLAYRLQ